MHFPDRRGYVALPFASKLMTMLLVAALVGFAAGAGSIFDDNWQPPRAPSPPDAVAPAPHVPATAPVPKVEGNKEVKPGPAPTPAPPVGPRPIPDVAEQTKVRKLFKEIFSQQLANRTPAGRRQLAQLLIDKAEKSPDAPVDQFVMLAGARSAAIEAGDTDEAIRADDDLAKAFAIDASKSRVEVLTSVSRRVSDPAAGAEVVKKCLQGADEAVRKESFDDARQLSDAALAAARASGDSVLLRRTTSRAGPIRDLVAGYMKAQKALTLLKTSPNDASANSEVGYFYCLVAGNWMVGLPYLAAGTDSTLKAAAAADLNGADAVSIGDTWWNLSNKQPAAVKQQMQRRAAKWYREALASLTGLARAKIDLRLAQLDAAPFRSDSEYMTIKQGQGPVTLLQKGQGFAVLASIAGRFEGASEGGGVVYQDDDGTWQLQAKSAQGDMMLGVIKYPRSGELGLNAEIHEYQWQRGGSKIKLIHRSEGFCFLSLVVGRLLGSNEKAEVTIGPDGYWYLDCSAGDVDLWVRAVSVKPSNPKLFSLDFREVTWKPGSAPVKMIAQDEGIVFLTCVRGGMRGMNDTCGLQLGKDGYWYLGATGNLVSAKAMAIKYLPNPK